MNRADTSEGPDAELSVVIVDRGLDGVLLHKGPGWSSACERHEAFLRTLAATPPARVGALVLLRLIADVPVLTFSDLSSIAGPAASAYELAGRMRLEWPRGNGWIDRRNLCEGVAGLIRKTEGLRLNADDWSAGAAFLRAVHGGTKAVKPWAGVIADAQVWWLVRLPPLLFAHVVAAQKLQPLPRAAWDRQSRRESSHA